MACNELVVRVAGEAGEGVISTGDLLARAAARAGFHLITFKTFPAEVKGGHSVFQFRVSSGQVLTQGDEVDLLVAMNSESFSKHESDLSQGARVVYDSSKYVPETDRKDLQLIGIPFHQIASEELQFELGKNMVAVGAMTRLLALSLTEILAMVVKKFKRKGERILQRNETALELGSKWVKDHLADEYGLCLEPPVVKEDLMFATGNEAIGLGAMAYGVKHFFGYPITPASEIMEFMARHLPKIGGVMLQAEDEIASIAMAIGASFSGVPAMTATSGPGLSLMAEALGLAGIIEAPVVIVDVQRAGPSTGMPTKHEQGDLYVSMFGGHGDLPRVVIAPHSVRDCFEQMIVAFNIAESLQLPVIVLSDQGMAVRTQTIPIPNLSTIHRKQRVLWEGGEEEYLRFADTETGVTPMALPGMKGGEHVVSGLEQSEEGRPRYDGETHTRLTEKRFKKLNLVPEMIEGLFQFGDPEAETAVIAWGSTVAQAREAVKILAEKGTKIAGLGVRLLSPFPLDDIVDFLSNKRSVVIAEMNYQGQMASFLEGRAGESVRIHRLNSISGVPFGTNEVIAALEEVV
jgi:2-oxoglutarate ferredoxin oxidoreductase subunit alpha